MDTSHTSALGYMRVVPHRNARTLLPIIQTTVAPGSTVHSDEWAAYCSIQSTTGFTHKTVNHSLHFFDPTTGVQTNNVESYWNRAKLKLKAMRGCTKDQLPSYVDEFMWKEQFGRDQDDRFLNMLKHYIQILLSRNFNIQSCTMMQSITLIINHLFHYFNHLLLYIYYVVFMHHIYCCK